MNRLTPLIELASTGSLDLFFRVGRGYVAQAIVMEKAGPYPGFQPSSEIVPD